MARTLLSLAIFAFLLASCWAFTPSSIAGVVSSLPTFQTYSGGFAPIEDGNPTLEATEQALFLASLFGSKNQINVEAVATYLQSLATSDNGFSNVPGGSSDMAAVSNAILSYSHIGNKVPNPTAVGAYIANLYDADTRLYGNTPGASGDLKSTALALQALQLLGVEPKEEVVKGLRSYLKSAETDANGVKSFSSATEDNTNCIIIASLVDYDFGDDVTPFAAYYYARQNANGGFNSGPDATAESYVQDAAAAVHALHILQVEGKTDLISSIDSRALLGFIHRLPRSLPAAFFGYKALARTRSFNDVFQHQLAFEAADARHRVTQDRIIAGSEVRPVFLIRAGWGTWHSGFDVTLNIKQGKETNTMKLLWNPESERYVAASNWDASTYLGRVTFETYLRLAIADLGEELVIKLSDSKSIGYDIGVVSKATYAGKEVDIGGNVGQGTDFSFEVQLGSVSEPKPELLAGDFDVIFQVKDSSLVVIHEAKFDARKNTKPFTFDYTLDKVNIPSGALLFTFSVSAPSGIHTTDRVIYNLPLTTVASEITFSGEEFKLGDDVEVTFVPATLTGKTVAPFSGYDLKGKQANRRFFMDIISPSGEVISAVPGDIDVDDDEKVSVKFTYSIGASFDSIGANKVAFRYQAADGTAVPLLNYDTALGELFEETRKLGFSVKGDLRLSDVTGPTLPANGKLDYGQTIDMSFVVKDKVTGMPIAAVGDSTVYLILKGTDKNGQSYVTTRIAATPDPAEPAKYDINWVVNPNAEKGKSTMELVAQGADGKDIPLLNENGEVFSKALTVGGEIDVEQTSYSKPVIDARSTDSYALFFTNFFLSSGGKGLSGAKLIAKVVSPSGREVAFVPVTEGIDSEGQNLGYQASWTTSSKTEAGYYTAEFYRVSDRKRVGSVDPFFTIKVKYDGSTTSWLPFRTEFIAILLIGAAFVLATTRKFEMTGGPLASKKK